MAIHNFQGDFACFNDGLGNFTCQFLGDADARSWSLTIADYDGDLDLDILPDVSASYGVWYQNEGSRVFAVVPPAVDNVIAAGHLDDDEFVDVISRAGGGKIYLNNGDGSFTLSQTLFSGGTFGGPAIGDVDGDTDNDLALGGRLWVNDGRGMFSDSGQDLMVPGADSTLSMSRS